MTKKQKSDLEKILDKNNLNTRQLNTLIRNKDKPDNLNKYLNKYNVTEQELVTILKSSKLPQQKNIKLDIPDKYIRIGYFSDPHIGHSSFREDGFDLMRKVFKKEKVDLIITAGDNLEGMSHRPGHIYELSHVGFSKQINYAAELYNSLSAKIFGIDGNHDQWYYRPQNAGVIVGDELEARVKKYTNLGQDEANLQLSKGKILKLYHGGDGTAYADSYKIQKLIESFTGGEKPSIVMSGHYHKSLFLARRNIFGFECGTLCGQTRYMRGKKLQAHIGFGIADIYLKENPGRVKHEWFQLYDNNKSQKRMQYVKI